MLMATSAKQQETYINFAKLDINPRIIEAARKCGLVSSEGVLFGSSKHCPHGSRLPAADHLQLVAAVAAIHCPRRSTGYDFYIKECGLLAKEHNSTITIKGATQCGRTLLKPKGVNTEVIKDESFEFTNKLTCNYSLQYGTSRINTPNSESSISSENKRSTLNNENIPKQFNVQKRELNPHITNYSPNVQNVDSTDGNLKEAELVQIASHILHDAKSECISISKHRNQNVAETSLVDCSTSRNTAYTVSSDAVISVPVDGATGTRGASVLCPVLGRALCDVLRWGSVTEVCGESATGKTQLALSVALHATLPKHLGGLAAKAAYLCTEGQFPTTRLQQLTAGVPHRNVADSIFVQQLSDTSSLLNCVLHQLPALLRQQMVRVVVVDSVAAPFRTGEEGISWQRRHALLTELGYSLRQLAHTHNIAVLAVNQVTGRMEGPDLYGLSSECRVSPALGLAWSNTVTTRLMLTRQDRADDGPVTRHINVVFCPWLPRLKLPFVVTANGVAGVAL